MPTEGRIPKNTVRVSINHRTGVQSIQWGGGITAKEEILQIEKMIQFFNTRRDWLQKAVPKGADD